MEQYRNLTVIPYVADYAEFAARTREEILERKDSDFIVAVDLPQGLEDQIIKAVRSLPETSMIIDALKRGILITPSSAPVEAVRSYLEYGYDLHCIDASLPVTGTMSEYEYFIHMCRLHGPETVINRPEQFGISKEDIFQAWAGTAAGNLSGTPAFFSLPRRFSPEDCPPFDPASSSPYRITRLQCMAMHLKKLLGNGPEVLFVCSRANVNGVLTFLQTDLPSFDDSYRLPTTLCSVPEKLLFSLSREMPFMTYTYELFRDTPFDRERWIRHLFTETCGSAPAQRITGAIEYTFRLALADFQVYPDLYNVTAAAKYFVDDSCAFRVYEKGVSYPPSRNLKSNCQFAAIVDYNFNPLSEVRSLSLKSAVINRPLPSINPRKKSLGSLSCYYRFTRTSQCLQAELDLMKYLRSQFRSSNLSVRESMPVTFTCGLRNGIDCRQTIRHKHERRIYVRQPVMENDSCYVLDYRPAEQVVDIGSSKGGSLRFRITVLSDNMHPTHVFFDKNYPWIGVTLHAGHHYESRVMVAFMSLPFSPTKIYDKISYANPLVSSVGLGLKYAKQVFVFSDHAKELLGLRYPQDRVKVYPTGVLPPAIREKMRTFDITGYRYDDRPGD